MSMVSELVKELRKYAKGFKNSSYGREIVGTEKLLIQAADTIEELSAKVARQNMERSSQYYGGGWISVDERLPEEPFGCIVTVQDTEPVTGTDYECIFPYFVGYDGEQWNDSDGEQIPVEVIAWQPLPPAYEPKGGLIMARLIEADELIKDIQEQYKLHDNNPMVCEIVGDIIHNLIETAPTVDAEPVRYGKWIKSQIPYEEFVCSECGGACWYYDVNKTLSKSRYCPNCGAKMTGGIQNG